MVRCYQNPCFMFATVRIVASEVVSGYSPSKRASLICEAHKYILRNIHRTLAESVCLFTNYVLLPLPDIHGVKMLQFSCFGGALPGSDAVWQNKVSTIAAITIITMLGIVAVILRLVARNKASAGLAVDDYVLFASLVRLDHGSLPVFCTLCSKVMLLTP